jgi:class 3 adenylate cyclase/tetratricopeptide (TPR) repeat protein
LGAAAPPPSRGAGEPPPSSREIALSDADERRRVTVLFCDLVGAAQLSQRLDPEDMHRVLRAYQAAAEAVIERHGGHIAQYLGDGLLVYFGYPEERPGSARSAALAALEIIDAVEGIAAGLAAERGVDIAARIGMHSGEGVAGDVGGRLKREQLVVGRAPNIAARLRELAAPGTVVVSDATRALVEDDVELLRLGLRELKGIAEPVAVHRLLSKRHAPAALSGARPLDVPFAGPRVAQGAVVEAARAAAAGAGRVVLLRGAEGSGKSRAVREACAALSDLAVSVRIARCRAKTKLTPFDPFAQALGELFDRAEPPDDAMLTPAARGEHTRKALADMLVDLARERPALLVVEDLELADPSSLALLADLAARAPSSRLSICATFCPPFEPALGSAASALVNVEPLAPEVALSLVRAAAAPRVLAPDVQRRIVSYARGLPIEILELARAAARAPEGAEPVLDLGAVVRAALDDLGPAREVAAVASVLGPRFERDVLAVLCPFDAPTLQGFLDRLEAAGILVMDAGELAFSHAIVRDAVYGAIAPVRRRDAHEKAARAFARGLGPGDRRGAIVAWHLERAGLGPEAAQHLAADARRALQSGAGAEAIAMLEGALHIVTTSVEGPGRPRLEIELRAAHASALVAVHGPAAPRLGQHLTRARELGKRIDAPEEIIQIARAQWLVARWQANGPALFALTDEIVTLAARRYGRPWPLWAAFASGTTAFYRGRLKDARAELSRAEERHDPSEHALLVDMFGEDPAVASVALRGWIDAMCGARGAAFAAIDRADRLAAELRDPAVAVRAAVVRMIAHHDLDEPRAALDAARRALEMASRQGMPIFAAAARCGLGWALARTGDAASGIAEIEVALAVFESTGRKIELAYWGSYLADAALRASRFDLAARVLDDAVSRSSAQLDAPFKPEMLRLYGELVAARDGDHERAASLCQRAAETARTYGALAWALPAAVSRARALIALGRGVEAEHTLAAALSGADAAEGTEPHRAAAALRSQLDRSPARVA